MKVYLDRIVVSCYTHFYAPVDEGRCGYDVPRLRRGDIGCVSPDSPLGNKGFVRGLEKRLNRPLAPGKAGRKPKQEGK
jgi:hypothetical protein